MNRYSLPIAILIYFASCSDEGENNLKIRDYYAEGTADTNHLEKGLWKYYSLDRNELCQQGEFINGLRTGKWNYYYPLRDSIFWVPYYSKDSLIKTNIPSFLTLDQETQDFLSFLHQDTSRLFLLKIAIGRIEIFDRIAYNNAMLREIKANSVKLRSKDFIEFQTTCGQVYNLHKFSGIDRYNRDYTLFTINCILNGILAEITLRCKTDNNKLGEEVFYSVMSNMFVESNRFFDGNIDCEVITNSNARSRTVYSFGCNKK